MKRKNILHLFVMLTALAACSAPGHEVNTLRAPAYPLVSIDPYTSAWSMYDNLYDGPVKHWTGREFPLIGALKVDGEVYRFLGQEDIELTPVAHLGYEVPWSGSYTFSEPSGAWYAENYKAAGWKTGLAPFATPGFMNSQTAWQTPRIWIRREVNLGDEIVGKRVFLAYSNDDNAEFYVNGVKVLDTGMECHNNAYVQLPDGIVKPGRNVIAATCTDTGGLACVDVGITVQENPDTELSRTAVQLLADVQATQTHYKFACGPVNLELSFSAPLFLDDLELISRPVNYITYTVASSDGKEHDVDIYFEAAPAWALDQPGQPSHSEAFERDGRIYLKSGSKAQTILSRRGDDVRIDWGWFYLSAADGNYGVGGGRELRQAFRSGRGFASSEGDDASGRMAIVRKVRSGKSDHILIGYDDVYSIQYFGENLRPYWNRNGDRTIFDMFEAAEADYAGLMARCARFDRELFAEAKAAGGKKYAELCALAYRQSIHAHKLVQSSDGELHWFSKENNSNGSIGTVDITYPSSPLYLRYNPKFAEYMMNHIYHYSESGRWTKPFPAHDVGTYPMANGQTYGGDMPVEEAGNMIILTAAVCKVEGSADYARKHWETLTTWTEYLSQYGLDPENQLCTDDFAGHFAHNANLSIKAILAVASYGYMAGLLGQDDVRDAYMQRARSMAAEWMVMDDDGDHYRLTFDRPGTWSQKYNLVWDGLLGFDIFPDEVRQKEIAYYLKHQNRYGLPLDSRETYTKTDWIAWTAAMAGSDEEFEAFIAPVWDFMNETVDRIPMSDWVYTDKPNFRGFRARSVVGGYFIKLLDK